MRTNFCLLFILMPKEGSGLYLQGEEERRRRQKRRRERTYRKRRRRKRRERKEGKKKLYFRDLMSLRKLKDFFHNQGIPSLHSGSKLNYCSCQGKSSELDFCFVGCLFCFVVFEIRSYSVVMMAKTHYIKQAALKDSLASAS